MNDDSLMFDALLRLMRILRDRLDETAQDLGLTFARARVVAVLSRMEGATQTELAQALRIEPPTLKRQIDALERDGVVERRSIEGDRRKRGLFLSETARKTSVGVLNEAVRSELTKGIGRDEKLALQRAFDRLSENIVSARRA